MVHIRIIPTSDTYPIRQAVLRPGRAIETCYFEGDHLPTTLHFGADLDYKLVGVASLYSNPNTFITASNPYQLRGMAVLDGLQGKQIGSKLLLTAEDYVKNNKGDLLWFNARSSAVKFYQKHGFQLFGAEFTIPDVGPHYLMYKKF